MENRRGYEQSYADMYDEGRGRDYYQDGRGDSGYRGNGDHRRGGYNDGFQRRGGYYHDRDHGMRGNRRGYNARGSHRDGDRDRVSRLGGAGHLARIHGTEEDRVNCPFYFKIGACRHGDACSRKHNKPVFSQTIMLPHMYVAPDASKTSPEAMREHFLDFYEDVWLELSSCGELDEIFVAENLGDHLRGNVYAKFYDEEDAAAALSKLYGRFYDKRQLVCEFCPVTNFREARCRQHDTHECGRGGFCNFLHIIRVDPRFTRELKDEQEFAGVRSNVLMRNDRYR